MLKGLDTAADTTSMDTMNNTTTHRGAFLIITSDGTPAMLTDIYEQDVDGIWTWTGLWPAATAIKLTAGYIIKDWAMWVEDAPERGDWIIVKVNRVTIVVQRVVDGIAEGPTHHVRIAC